MEMEMAIESNESKGMEWNGMEKNRLQQKAGHNDMTTKPKNAGTKQNRSRTNESDQIHTVFKNKTSFFCPLTQNLFVLLLNLNTTYFVLIYFFTVCYIHSEMVK